MDLTVDEEKNSHLKELEYEIKKEYMNTKTKSLVHHMYKLQSVGI